MMRGKDHPFLFTLCVSLILPVLGSGICQAVSDANAPSEQVLVDLGPEMRAMPQYIGAIRWPRRDYGDVGGYVAEPNLVEQKRFLAVVKHVLEPSCLPPQMQRRVRFLKGWPVEGIEGFVLQYEKEPYVIRIKTQVTYVQATETRRDATHWTTIFVQRKDKSRWLDPKDPNAILWYADKFLSRKVNSSAQNYLNAKNPDGTPMNEPVFKALDQGYLVTYPVMEFYVGGVTIWTDGSTVIINLQELRKVRGPSSGD